MFSWKWFWIGLVLGFIAISFDGDKGYYISTYQKSGGQDWGLR